MKTIKGFEIQFDFSNFKKIADLIFFEGPLLSHYVSSKGDDYLFYWVDKDERDNRWLVLRVSLSSLQKYMAKDISLRELIENPNDGYLYQVDIDNDLNYHDPPSILPSIRVFSNESVLHIRSPKYWSFSFSISSVQFSHSVVPSSLQPHGLQLTRPPCPSSTPRVYSDLCPLIGDAIQPSHPLSSPSPPALNHSQHQGLFQ